MLEFTKQDVINELQKDLDRACKEQVNSISDLGYWAALSKAEFIKANLKHVVDSKQP